jgi:predicted 3-demethylubiquinone-9 3-methyltransferase (glyoxalase superfamily)
MVKPAKNTICLWYDRDAEEAARFYAETFPDSSVGSVHRAPMCGWCKDKWGLSWQITPVALTQAFTDPDPTVAKRAFDAMLEMKKIDIAAIEAALRG